jgi:dihydrofolate reductase
MIVSIIAALDDRRGIGYQGRLPWHLSTDLKRFKSLTMGHHIIMGRKTYLSIGKPLPGRTNIVLTKNEDYRSADVVVAHSIDDALEIARRNGETEVFIIGGGEIFRQALSLADQLYLTYVHTDRASDTFFPELDRGWKITDSVDFPADDKNEFSTTYCIYTRA